jgi:hypothetical protein
MARHRLGDNAGGAAVAHDPGLRRGRLWITTWSFWNTQFQWVRPSMRTEVSSEQTMRERRNRARMAATSLSKHGLARCNIASNAPSLIWSA